MKHAPKANQASFEFYGSLNDFLPYAKRNQLYVFPFEIAPSVKDAVEAIGIPHVEVEAIFMNHVPVLFSEHLSNQVQVDVYPVYMCPPIYKPLRPAIPLPYRFVLDVHLGSLARILRMLGFDTIYLNHHTDKAIAAVAEAEERIVLTRDVGLLKHKIISWGYWLRSQNAEEQFREINRRFSLYKQRTVLSRCIACNGIIHSIEKLSIKELIASTTYEYYQDFYQCSSCSKIYWKGSHYFKMLDKIKRLSES